ncbi:MAG: hypothetical protein AAGB11_03160 [Pseudomonadota bacterium]
MLGPNSEFADHTLALSPTPPAKKRKRAKPNPESHQRSTKVVTASDLAWLSAISTAVHQGSLDGLHAAIMTARDKDLRELKSWDQKAVVHHSADRDRARTWSISRTALISRLKYGFSLNEDATSPDHVQILAPSRNGSNKKLAQELAGIAVAGKQSSQKLRLEERAGDHLLVATALAWLLGLEHLGEETQRSLRRYKIAARTQRPPPVGAWTSATGAIMVTACKFNE